MKYNRILYLDNTETIYTRAIRDELKLLSKEVFTFFYDELYLSGSLYSKFFGRKDKEIRILQFLEYIKKYSYDLIFIKQPQNLPVFFFEELRNHFYNIPIINYNWSSVKMYNILPYTNYFDVVYTFDPLDAHKYSMKYLPLFFIKEFGRLSIKKSYKNFDLCFIGSGYNKGRDVFLKELVHNFKDLERMFLYIYTPGTIKSIKYILKNSELKKFCYWKPLHLNGVLNIFLKTYATIDHPMTIQTGLTMRTFEALAAGLHLYTTNEYIKKEPFYTPERITLIDSDLKGFTLNNKKIVFDKKYQESFQQYRVDNWLNKILEI